MAGAPTPISLPNYAGINFNTILQAIVAAGEQPIASLDQKIQGETASISALATIKGDLSVLNTRLLALQSDGANLPLNATTSSGAPFSVQTSGTPMVGTYYVNVTQLATNQVTVSQGYASDTSTVGTGTVTLTVGGTQYTINVTSSNDTLDGLAQAINAANTGVTAQVIDTGAATNPYELELVANQTGTNSAFSVSTSLSGGTAPTFTTIQSAQNAALTVDSQQFYSQSNTVTNAIPGLSINLNGVGSGTITVSQDAQKLSSDVQSFVSAYNQLLSDIRSNTQGERSEALPPLYANGAIEALGLGLQLAIGNVELSNLGVSVDNNVAQGNNGQLTFSQATLDSALASNPSGVQNSLTQLYNALNGIVTDALASNSGVIDSEISSYNDLINQQNQQISQLQQQLQQTESQFETLAGQVQSEIAYYANIAQLFFSGSSGTSGSSGSGLSGGSLNSIA